MSQTTTCPNCGASTSGNFCSSCGAALAGRHCTQCGSSLVPGARFCNECGAGVGASPDPTPPPPPATPTSGAARSAGGRGPAPRGPSGAEPTGGSSSLGWWVAGAMMVLIMVVLALPILRPEEPAAPAAGAAAGGMPTATTDISSMTPMEAADALYNRVMRAASADDTAQVQMFLPMAIDAHVLAEPLTADGAFHLSSLQRMGARNEEALQTAQQALEADPDHLLLLYSGAMAAQALGQDQVAREYAARMLEAWDREIGSAKEEYESHSGMMADIRAFAEANGG
jgi:hypothetical protein